MAMKYHIVYEAEANPLCGRRIVEEVVYSRDSLIGQINFLLNRNEDVLGVYITGTSCGDDPRDPRKLRKFIDYMSGLESQVWLGRQRR